MPFTPSHALVALPFVRTPLVPAAIAIGAMTPDLPLFLRGAGVSYGFTHTFGNVVWTSLLAFALFLVWRVVLRPAVPEAVPAAIARRLPAEWSETGLPALRRAVGGGAERARAVYPLMLAISLVLGVLSHIAWDLFTHEDREGVQLLPLLDEMWGPLPGYKWMQYGSSIGGLAILGIAALVWLRRRPAAAPASRLVPHEVRMLWWASLPVLLVGASIIGLIVFGPLDEEFTIRHLAYRMLPPACAIWGAITLVLCLLLPLLRSRRAGARTAPIREDSRAGLG